MKAFSIVIATLLASVVVAQTVPTVTINGSASPKILPARVEQDILLPLSQTLTALSGQVTRTGDLVTIKRDGRVVLTKVGARSLFINNEELSLDSSISVIGDNLYASHIWIGEALDIDVRHSRSLDLIAFDTTKRYFDARTVASADPKGSDDPQPKPAQRIAILPWRLVDGTDGGKKVAQETLREVLSKSGYELVGEGEVRQAAKQVLGTAQPETLSISPSMIDLARIGREVDAQYVMVGAITWHTKSVFVFPTNRTKATANLSMQCVDVKRERVSFTVADVKADSHETMNWGTTAIGVLIHPLGLVFSGPKDPHHRRSAQLVVVKAIDEWMKTARH